ncbi:hypothetical protein [Candidatus Tremblaya phenacola]|uniref:hypothetical protein n=1 Tax=Candidatus Tremblayella phenacoccinincola TaxID=1010676 RepID=UPI001649C3DB|nr:hypothetical protein [Candidatus Tremblaya phenacola]
MKRLLKAMYIIIPMKGYVGDLIDTLYSYMYKDLIVLPLNTIHVHEVIDIPNTTILT